MLKLMTVRHTDVYIHHFSEENPLKSLNFLIAQRERKSHENQQQQKILFVHKNLTEHTRSFYDVISAQNHIGT